MSGADHGPGADGDRRRGRGGLRRLPASQSFDLPPLFEGAPQWLDKYVLMATVSVIMILAFWLIMARQEQAGPEQGPVHRRDRVLLHPQLASPGT